MTLGIIGTKLGMTEIYDAEGLVIPVTVIKVDPLTVTQIKTIETDGYNALQVGTDPIKASRLTRPELKHLEKNNIGPLRTLKEFRIDNPSDFSVGQKIDVSILNDVLKVDVTGKSIGKGFQGTVKRHNFHIGPKAHGSKNHRIPGSIGAGTTPGRVYKGHKMAGHMGNEYVTVTKLKVVRIDVEKNLLLIKGSVPGTEGKLVTIKPSKIKWN